MPRDTELTFKEAGLAILQLKQTTNESSQIQSRLRHPETLLESLDEAKINKNGEKMWKIWLKTCQQIVEWCRM